MIEWAIVFLLPCFMLLIISWLCFKVVKLSKTLYEVYEKNAELNTLVGDMVSAGVSVEALDLVTHHYEKDKE